MKFVNKVLPFLYNKYVLAFVFLLVYTLIFDTNNITSQIQMQKQLNTLTSERDFYRAEIQRDSAHLVELLSEQANLERFAREQYLMKRDNEDVFILIGDDYMKIEDKSIK